MQPDSADSRAAPPPRWPLALGWFLAGLALARFAWLLSPTGPMPPPAVQFDPRAAPREVADRGALSASEEDAVHIFAQGRRSVVHIDSQRQEPGRGYFLGSANRFRDGLGSGILWDKQGHVVTNRHLIQGARASMVRLADGSEWRATLIGDSPAHDLAVLAIDALPERLEPIALGGSADLLVGQRVFAIGNPFGLDWTLTSGVLSGLSRVVEDANGTVLDGLIQTDAAINPGNSGGPLLDSAGRMIGINTAIVDAGDRPAGIGFAVPVDTVNRIVPMILANGSLPKAGIGVRLLADEATRRLGLEGALIAGVLAGSPAFDAGLMPSSSSAEEGSKPGDLIVAVNGDPIRSTRDLAAAFSRYAVGDTVQLTIEREDRRIGVPVVLGRVMPLDALGDGGQSPGAGGDRPSREGR